jgi:hypothetical protein
MISDVLPTEVVVAPVPAFPGVVEGYPTVPVKEGLKGRIELTGGYTVGGKVVDNGGKTDACGRIVPEVGGRMF